MSYLIDDFKYAEYENENSILNKLMFSKIYKKFNDYNKDSTGLQTCGEIKEKLSAPYDDEDLILHFCSILYNILANVKKLQNDLYDEITNDDNILCISLKYWLYEKIGIRDQKVSNINILFQSWKDSLETKLGKKLSGSCKIYELDWKDMNKLRKIYSFALIYYSNLRTFKKNHHIKCKLFDYLGKGLKAYYESLIECSNEKKGDNFCKELNEFKKIYKLDNIYWKNSTFSTGYVYNEQSTDNCPLDIESVQNPLRIKYQEENNIIYLSDQSMDLLNSSIISASSAIGTTVGVSAFLLYLYKYTSLGSLILTRIKNNNSVFHNKDTETYNFTLPTSEYDSTHFENNDYNIQYYSLNIS
ncbi:PIR Superfamily Protein [Plasmodium ovale curtisi]|uniref:PIR Superfamily Protein n=1 Tax=Plasmodium ovale curtisi TaxID=864141 RepID=A0A1A8WMN6_PLAOA|nr:PIR Superfamily Protein [Plasmodium ovale curtisi]SBT02026.1 PIR Superfamily Protein [Plasmodium ovale curtisi]